MWPRAILHVDMDCFYAAVEVLDDPSLRGKPVVVGGTGRRGVVAAASYEARVYGVRSATPMVTAKRLCPKAIVLPGRFDRYEEVSRQYRAIMKDITPLVEPISLDEAFLDVTGATRRTTTPEAIAAQLRQRVKAEIGLNCSVGVATSKHIAKLASVAAKPRALPTGVIEPGRGVMVIAPGTELAFLHPLPIRALWGVGEKTAKKLASLGVKTVGELAALPLDALTHALGPKAGEHLLDLANGRDDRDVIAEAAAKSISHEETFAYDLFDRADIQTQLVRMADGVATRLRASGFGARTISLKVRDATFATLTRSRTLPRAVDTAAAILDVVGPMIDQVEPTGGVRLLGVVASKFAAPSEQLQLAGLADDVETGAEQWSDASAAIDRVRGRFGSTAIGPASALSTEGLRIVLRGQQQWGTNESSGSESSGNDRPPD